MATSARNWKKPDNFELKLPSGNTCLVKRPGMEKLLSAGILPDTLTPIAMEAIKKSQSGPKQPEDHKKKKSQEDQGLDPELMAKFLEQEGALEDIFMAFDKVTAMCVIEPKVKLHLVQVMDEDGHPKKTASGRDVWKEIPEDERESEEERDFLYTDEVDGKDKEHIFNFVSGGSPELATFPDAGDDVATS